ncbi:MAG TPA: amidinotransferase [Thermoanaerobaculia bacterium]|nr:amidinotransferase [Thermoanaerobaculia bacterium]
MPETSVPRPPVLSYTEWDPLEEVVVGSVDGAVVPPWDSTLRVTMSPRSWPFLREHGGRPFPREWIDAGRRDLDGLVHLLEAEGVTVRRPDPVDFSRPYATPEWESASGLYAAMPRDLLMVVGDEILEAPMSWRSRYFEVHAFRELVKGYFLRGARWTAAPRPQLSDALFRPLEEGEEDREEFRSLVTEFEPVFDTADFVRCGRDLFVQRSHVTNAFGIEWLRRHLGDAYRIHEIAVRDTHPMHIDATFMPLAPGKLLVNPERIGPLPEMFRTWDVLPAPPPSAPDDPTLCLCSAWVSMNVLMLDEERVVVERREEALIRKLKDWGFQPIPCRFDGFYPFGGSFHCATLDVRRRGELRSYF